MTTEAVRCDRRPDVAVFLAWERINAAIPRPFGSRILRCFRKERGLVKRHVPKRDWYDYARLILQALAVATPYVILYLTH